MMKRYLGVRVEIANRLFVKGLEKLYNSTHKTTKIFDFCYDGKITVEKKGQMLMARGKNDRITTGLISFSVMIKVPKKEEIERIVQIVNVLGNDRLIREKISVFANGKSLLNAIPELNELKEAFNDLDALMPGFIRTGWYFAPDARF